jgi:hypothetical protein
MRRLRPIWFIAALVLVGWGLFVVAGNNLSEFLAARVGDALLRFGRGKFTDASVFIQGRLQETLWLTTLSFLWVVAHRFVNARLIRPNASPTRRWTAHAVLGFVSLNVWIAFAMQTVLFWGVLGAGAGHENYAQFQFKRRLAAEINAPMRAVLVGSSQTRAQIDEQLLNEQLAPKLWTTELHYPGSKASDLVWIEPQLAVTKADLVICYLSEGYFFNGASGETTPQFLSFGESFDAQTREAWKYIPPGEIGYGLLGNALPLFRCCTALSQRLLGATMMQIRQVQYDAALDADLESRATKTATLFRRDDSSNFQMRALEDFVARCEQHDRRVVLLVGGYNPILARQLDPTMRPEMIRFLEELQSRHANLLLVSEHELPRQTVADYDDLNHASLDMQRRFTEALAQLLQKQLDAPLPQATR